MLLKDVFAKDPRRPFESQVIVCDSSDFAAELEEYVLTTDSGRALEMVLESYLVPANPTTVWISGATGSGKSTLLKVLAHLLGDVHGAQFDRKAVTNHLRDPAAGAFLDALLTRVDALPATSLVFSGDRMALFAGDLHSDA
jgi:energy-coupling factor transporter ATP-binding protein EcfA2